LHEIVDAYRSSNPINPRPQIDYLTKIPKPNQP
jgi:hypothetical protein